MKKLALGLFLVVLVSVAMAQQPATINVSFSYNFTGIAFCSVSVTTNCADHFEAGLLHNSAFDTQASIPIPTGASGIVNGISGNFFEASAYSSQIISVVMVGKDGSGNRTVSDPLPAETVLTIPGGSAGGVVPPNSPTSVISSWTTGAAFPVFAYNMWEDFEQCTLGAAPTAACLESSTHGQTSGTWSVSGSELTVTAACKDVSPADHNPSSTRGLQYTSATGVPAWATYTLPAPLSQLSAGFWYKSAASYGWSEGPHAFVLSSNAYGDMERFVDERDGGGNTRQFRLSPFSAANDKVTGIADNTWYWISFLFVNGGTVKFSVYDANLTLIGTASDTDNIGVNVNSIRIGNDLSEPLNYTNCMPDMMLNNSATFPLIP
jgi:hypothetical protein